MCEGSTATILAACAKSCSFVLVFPLEPGPVLWLRLVWNSLCGPDCPTGLSLNLGLGILTRLSLPSVLGLET